MRDRFLEELVIFNRKLIKGELHRHLLSDEDTLRILRKEFKLTWAVIFPYLPSERKFHFPSPRSKAYATPNYYTNKQSSLYKKWVEWQQKELISVTNIHRAGILLHKTYQSPVGDSPRFDFISHIQKKLDDEFKRSETTLGESFQDFTCVSSFSLLTQGTLQLVWRCLQEGYPLDGLYGWLEKEEMPTKKWPVSVEVLKGHSDALYMNSKARQPDDVLLDAFFSFTKSLYLYAFNRRVGIPTDQAIRAFDLYRRYCKRVIETDSFNFDGLLELASEELKGDANDGTLLELFNASIPFNYETVISLNIRNLMIKPLGMGLGGSNPSESGDENFVGLLISDLKEPISEVLSRDKTAREKLSILTNYLILPVILHDRATKEEELKVAREKAAEMIDFASGFSHEMTRYLTPPTSFIVKLHSKVAGHEATAQSYLQLGLSRKALEHAYSYAIWLSDVSNLFIRYIKGTLHDTQIDKPGVETLLERVSSRLKTIVLNDDNLKLKLGEERLREIKIQVDSSGFPDHRLIIIDSEGLITALVNLMINAVNSFNKSVGTYVLLNMSVEGDRLIVRVEDNGLGFDRSEAENFGKPGKQGGAGIGAKIVKMFVNRFDGDIVVRSLTGPTVVELHLPLLNQGDLT